jgi:hypothetical protein
LVFVAPPLASPPREAFTGAVVFAAGFDFVFSCAGFAAAFD